jgi:hypothetical protein
MIAVLDWGVPLGALSSGYALNHPALEQGYSRAWLIGRSVLFSLCRVPFRCDRTGSA